MIVFKKASNRQWYFVVKARNGKVIATSETYKQKRSAVKGAAALKKAIL